MSAAKNSGVIHAIMCDRLGNQLFRYAYARALQVKYYPDYHINVNFYHFINDSIQKQNENSLQYFRLNDDITYTYENTKKLRTPLQFVLNAIQVILEKILPHKIIYPIDTKLLQPLFNKAGLYNPLSYESCVLPRPSHSKNIICSACFEAYGYVADIRDILLEEFTPKYDVMPQNIPLLDEINNSESVSIHIRRGDFLAPENDSVYNVCNEEYFVSAAKAIREELPDCKFFVFSDDIENVKRNIHIPFEARYVSSDIPPYETLRLMYSCKHFIISNSTFSWWGQYLGRNPGKIVYAPSPWRRSWRDLSGMYTPNMRLIPCSKADSGKH